MQILIQKIMTDAISWMCNFMEKQDMPVEFLFENILED